MEEEQDGGWREAVILSSQNSISSYLWRSGGNLDKKFGITKTLEIFSHLKISGEHL